VAAVRSSKEHVVSRLHRSDGIADGFDDSRALVTENSG
jgi:hypothetical protein